MTYPTLSDALDAEPGNYLDARNGLNDLASNIESHAARMVREVSSVPWRGLAHDAATGRAAEEQTSIGRIATAARQCATAIDTHVTSLKDLKFALIYKVVQLFVDNYSVANDWTVTDSKTYPSGDEAQQFVNSQEKERREQAARDATSALKGKAGEFAAADQQLASAVHSGIEGMNALSPAGAAVSIHSADQLLDDLADHRRLSGTELAELREATGLTPEQIEAIRQGKPVDIPPNKYAYLREVMAGLDSKSPAEIDRIADYLDPGSRDSVKTALANGMQLMGNPLITDKRGNHGGMTELPAKVRESLQRNPVTFDIDNPAAGIYWRLNNYHDLVALTDLLGKGNADLRVNTDVDRGLLKQASELASATSNRQGLFLETDDETGHLVSDKDLNATINSMIALTDADHPAITDFLPRSTWTAQSSPVATSMQVHISWTL